MKVLNKIIFSHTYSMFCILFGLISKKLEWSWAWEGLYCILFGYFFIIVIATITVKGFLLADKNHTLFKRNKVEKLLLVKKIQIAVLILIYTFELFFYCYGMVFIGFHSVMIYQHLLFSYFFICFLGLFTSVLSLNIFTDGIKKNKRLIFVWILTIIPLIDIFILTPLTKQQCSYNYDNQIPRLYQSSFAFAIKTLYIFVTIMTFFVMSGDGMLGIASFLAVAITSIRILIVTSHIVRLCMTKNIL